jgi:hypothetical protein
MSARYLRAPDEHRHDIPESQQTYRLPAG